MNPLNEAFESSIAQKMWSQPFGKQAFQLLRNAYRDLDINRLKDSDFDYLNPQNAFDINADGLKFWINSGKIVGITRSNSCFDKYFEVKKSKRGQIVCVTPEFMNMYSQPGKRKNWSQAVVGCYVLDVNAAIKNGASVKGTQYKRKLARTGALALMTNRQIKQENIKRYVQMLKDKRFSDGSEFNLINNIYSIVQDYIKRGSATQFFTRIIVGDTWFLNYLQAYSNSIMDYIELLDKNCYTLPNDVNIEDYWERNANDEQKLAKLRDDLKKCVDDVKGSLRRDGDYWNKAVAAIVSGNKDLEDYHQIIEGARGYNKNSYDTIIAFVRFLEANLLKAMSNPNITNNLMNFDLFITQLVGIHEQLRNNDQYNKLRDFMDSLQYWCEKHPTDVSSDDMYLRISSINASMLRRVESYINMISKI